MLTGSRTRESVPVLVQERIASGETALVMGFVQTNYHTIMREMDRIMSENWSWNLSFTRTSDRSPPREPGQVQGGCHAGISRRKSPEEPEMQWQCFLSRDSQESMFV